MEKGSDNGWRAHRLALIGGIISSLIFPLLTPVHPWGPPHDQFPLREIDGLDARRARAVADIYAVLESRQMRLDPPDVLKLAQCIQEESEKRALDPELVLAIIEVESRFDHRAVSPRGARGLMQIRPVAAAAVAEEVGLPDGKVAKSFDDPIVNVRVGTAYLRHLKDLFSDLKLTLVAYNWGPTRLRQALAAKQSIPRLYADKVILAQRAIESNRMRVSPLSESAEPRQSGMG
jgi:hypothetical protein